MSYYTCVCLDCARISSFTLGSERDIEHAPCPNCGRKRLALLPAGTFSGGG